VVTSNFRSYVPGPGTILFFLAAFNSRSVFDRKHEVTALSSFLLQEMSTKSGPKNRNFRTIDSRPSFTRIFRAIDSWPSFTRKFCMNNFLCKSYWAGDRFDPLDFIIWSSDLFVFDLNAASQDPLLSFIFENALEVSYWFGAGWRVTEYFFSEAIGFWNELWISF